jgi:hypothetical protein
LVEITKFFHTYTGLNVLNPKKREKITEGILFTTATSFFIFQSFKLCFTFPPRKLFHPTSEDLKKKFENVKEEFNNVAEEMGVKTPCISFHVGNTFNSYSQGSIIFCTASLIVSRLLLNDELESITMDNYMGNNREAWTVLKESLKTTRRQNRFVLSHELTHIAQEHSLFWTLYQPISLLAVHQLLKRKTLFFGSRPFLSLLSALLMSTCSSPFLFKYLESRADTAALFSKEMCLGGLTHIDRLLERNRAIRALVKANSAVDSGISLT